MMFILKISTFPGCLCLRFLFRFPFAPILAFKSFNWFATISREVGFFNSLSGAVDAPQCQKTSKKCVASVIGLPTSEVILEEETKLLHF